MVLANLKMNKTVLTLKKQPHVPLEAEVLCPDVLDGLSHDEVRSQLVYLGKRRLRLDEFFDVEGDGSENIEIHGSTRQIKWIGKQMSRGGVVVHGDVGMHLGAYMKGGSIEVHGDAGDWVGAEMAGGFIRVTGNAGGQIGAAYRGSSTGMRNGTILIGGSAGLEVGMRMRKGTIVFGGPVRDFVGLQMKGGTIVLLKGAELRTGAWMTRGTIISLEPLAILPTFHYCCTYQPTFLQLYARRLRDWGMPMPVDLHAGTFERYAGDSSVPGQGELLIWNA